jgi:hypothetical protein
MARGIFFSRRGGFPRFWDPDDFLGGMKWIVAPNAGCLLDLVSDLSKPGSDR